MCSSDLITGFADGRKGGCEVMGKGGGGSEREEGILTVTWGGGAGAKQSRAQRYEQRRRSLASSPSLIHTLIH